MQARRTLSGAWFLVALFVLQSTLSTLDFNDAPSGGPLQNDDGVEWVQFDLVDGVYADAVGVFDEGEGGEQRQITADTRIGLFDANGLHLDRPMPSAWLQGRTDLRLVLVVARAADPAVYVAPPCPVGVSAAACCYAACCSPSSLSK